MIAVIRVMVIASLMLGCVVPPALAQAPASVWRELAQKTDLGTELKVRLHSGQRFNAVLLGVRDDALVLQPKTRVPVPPQKLAYDDIAALERRREGGVGAGKAAAIGVASGVGTFFAILAIFVASAMD